MMHTTETTTNVATYTMISCGMTPESASAALPIIDEMVAFGVSRECALFAVAKCSVNFGSSPGDVAQAIKTGTIQGHCTPFEMASMVALHASIAASAGLNLDKFVRALAALTCHDPDAYMAGRRLRALLNCCMRDGQARRALSMLLGQEGVTHGS